jgi:GNAT superfamily N-acetyltransferase
MLPAADRAAYAIRDAAPGEYEALGQLMIRVYTALDGFPKPSEQPRYYDMLANIGAMAQKPGARLLAAIGGDRLLGGVVYLADMAEYGSGGTATREKDAAGFRLLAVDPDARGLGVGRALIQACLDLAMAAERRCVVIHTTKAMRVAWGIYESMGFRRAEDLDFMQGDLEVFGFRLML